MKYSLNGGELSWYFKKKYWQFCYQGIPIKNIDKLIIFSRKLGVQCNSNIKKNFLEIDDMIIKNQVQRTHWIFLF
jgi:hypothetical protein